MAAFAELLRAEVAEAAAIAYVVESRYPDDRVANVADVIVVVPVNTDVAVAAALGCCIDAAKTETNRCVVVAVNVLALLVRVVPGDAE